jgi:flagellar biosynthetic protein FliR
MVVTDHALLDWLGRILWPFLRLTGLFLTAPLYSSALIPARVKAIFVFALAWCLSVWMPHLPAFPAAPAAVMLGAATQLTVGGAIGLIAQIILSALASAGEVAGLSMGLSFAALQFRDAEGNTETLYDLMLWVGLIGYIILGGPVWLIGALAHSFEFGLGGLDFDSWAKIAQFGSVLITSAVMLALPVMAVSLCVNLTIGLMTVFAPQLNLLTIGFPLLILAGLSILAASVLFLNGPVEALLNEAMRLIAEILPRG